MEKIAIEIAKEARRQFENCLYTSSSLYEWLKLLKFLDGLMTISPIIFGSLATWKVLDTGDSKFFVSFCALMAAIIPIIQKSSKIKEKIAEVGKAAGCYTNMRDRFRQIAMISAHKDVPNLEIDFQALMQKMEEVRLNGTTAPELSFKAAQRKIKLGDYDSDFELAAPEAFSCKVEKNEVHMIRIITHIFLLVVMDVAAIFGALFWVLSANAAMILANNSGFLPEVASFLNVQSASFNWIAALLTGVATILIPITRWVSPK